MLTKTDLSQIGKIVRDEVRGEINPIKKDVASLKQGVGGLKIDMRAVKADVSGLKQDVGGLKRDMKGVRSDIWQIKKDLKTTINFFDHEHLELQERVGRLELRAGVAM